MSEVNDLLLVQQCLEDNIQAFEALFARYQITMYNLALRMTGNRDDAEDLTQSAFIKAFENLDKFKPEYKFFSWLYRIMVNESINFLNRRRQVDTLDNRSSESSETPEDAYHRSEISEIINKALMELNLDARIVIVLRHFVDLSYREISEITGVKEKTVKSRLYSARKALGSILTRKGVVTYE
jgi:RNA polymerase sigma-70 factor (ECF subfamily)